MSPSISTQMTSINGDMNPLIIQVQNEPTYVTLISPCPTVIYVTLFPPLKGEG